MSGYPWSVLGLEAPAGEREIRSAYARRLKSVRPDTDPQGFQKLVEARGYALEFARSRAADTSAQDGECDDEDHQPDAAGRDTIQGTVPQVAPPADPPTEPPIVVPAPVLLGLAPHDPGPGLAEPPSPAIAPSVSIELQDQLPDPDVPLATGEPLSGVANPLAPKSGPPSVSPAISAAIILLEPDEVVARLRNLFSTMGPPPSPEDAARALSDLERLPRSIRQMIEPDILRAMARSLPPPVKETFPRLAALLRRMHLIPDKLAGRHASAELRRTLFVALDETYGWTTSDRHVHQTLPQGQAAQLMAHLHASQSEQRVAREGLPPRRDADGLPILDAADLHAFFGSELPHYGVAYHEAKRARRWVPKWRPWLVLFAPIWMLPLRQYRLIGIWLIVMMFSGFLINFVERSVAPLLKVRFAAAYEPLTLLAYLLAWAPVAALHVQVARNSGRLEVERLTRLAAKADRKGLFDPQQRAKFLQKRAPGFRFEDGKKKFGGIWGGTWMWIIIGITVVRLIGMMLK